MALECEAAAEMDGVAAENDSLPEEWTPPPTRSYKLNADAAVSREEQAGLGGVTRDWRGDVVLATCLKVDGSFAVDILEAMAVRNVLKTSIEAGFVDVIIESDNMKVFSHLSKSSVEHTVFGKVIADIRKLAIHCNSCSFSFVKRGGNKVAHGLAKLSLNHTGFKVWLEEYPVEVHDEFVMDSSISIV